MADVCFIGLLHNQTVEFRDGCFTIPEFSKQRQPARTVQAGISNSFAGIWGDRFSTIPARRWRWFASALRTEIQAGHSGSISNNRYGFRILHFY
jgi:hypothetical protein